MDSSLHDFFRRLADAMTQAEPEEALSQAGIDLWEATEDPLTGTERSGAVDPREGALFRSVVFPPAFQRSADYPVEWPFVLDCEAAYYEGSLNEQTVKGIAWIDPRDFWSMFEDVRQQLEADGWSCREIPPPAEDASYTLPHNFLEGRKAGRTRFLCFSKYHGTQALLLIEGRAVDIWPQQAGGTGQAV